MLFVVVRPDGTPVLETLATQPRLAWTKLLDVDGHAKSRGDREVEGYCCQRVDLRLLGKETEE